VGVRVTVEVPVGVAVSVGVVVVVGVVLVVGVAVGVNVGVRVRARGAVSPALCLFSIQSVGAAFLCPLLLLPVLSHTSVL